MGRDPQQNSGLIGTTRSTAREHESDRWSTHSSLLEHRLLTMTHTFKPLRRPLSIVRSPDIESTQIIF